jgi:hypothetical protein
MLSVTTLWVGAAAAMAADPVIAEGTCSQGSTWKLEATPDEGLIEVEFGVDSEVAGESWGVALLDNRQPFFAQRVTTDEKGDYAVSAFATDQSGDDRIRAVTRNRTTGEVCTGLVIVPA